MKLTVRASLTFKRSKTSEKPVFGANVITSLTAAATTFPSLPVPIAQLTTINTQLAQAIASALSGNHSAVADVKVKAAAWDVAFTKTAVYVTSVANGSDVIVRSAGFVPTKSETSPVQKPTAVANFKATINGSKGAIIAGSKNAVPEAKAYVYTAAPEGVNVSFNDNTMIITVGDKTVYVIADTQKQTEFFNLPSGTPFNVNMYALNSAGSGPASAAQQVVTQ